MDESLDAKSTRFAVPNLSDAVCILAKYLRAALNAILGKGAGVSASKVEMHGLVYKNDFKSRFIV